MQTVSSNFLAAVQGSTTPVFYADLWKDNQLVATFPLESGEVSMDADSDIQGDVRLVVADADGTLTPTSIGSPLTPFGSVVNVRAGFKIGATEEVVSLGWFVIWEMEIQEAWKSYTDASGSTTLVRNGSLITISGRDLMQKVADYKFLTRANPGHRLGGDRLPGVRRGGHVHPELPGRGPDYPVDADLRRGPPRRCEGARGCYWCRARHDPSWQADPAPAEPCAG